jgi:hypothetical protein
MMVKVRTWPCPWCTKTSVVEVDAESYRRWRSGTLVQDAFPMMSLDEREMLVTGTHPACWNDMMIDMDEEEPFNDECGCPIESLTSDGFTTIHTRDCPVLNSWHYVEVK